jgi:hypothetical protein
VAVGAEDLEVLQSVVVTLPIDVVQCEWDRMPPPFTESAGLAAPSLEAGVEQPTLEVVAVASHACDEKLLQRKTSRARGDSASMDRVVPRGLVESEHLLAVRDTASVLVIPPDFRNTA